MKILLGYAFAVLVTVMLLVWLGLTTLDHMVSSAKETARAERDAYWLAEIERSNAETEKRLRLQVMAAQAADAVARDQIQAAQMRIEELEKANEALPDNRCGGLGRDRVELLHRGPK